MFRWLLAFLSGFLRALPRRRAPRMAMVAALALTLILGGLAVKPSDASANTTVLNASACNYAANYCGVRFKNTTQEPITVRFDWYSGSCACYAYDYYYSTQDGAGWYWADHYIPGNGSSVTITIYAPRYTRSYEEQILVGW